MADKYVTYRNLRAKYDTEVSDEVLEKHGVDMEKELRRMMINEYVRQIQANSNRE